MNSIKHPAIFAVFIFFFSIGTAQIPKEVKKEIQYRVKNKINPSIAIGLSDSTGTHFYVHGYKNLETQVKADENTLYEIGSITKTFTALLLAKYATEDSIDINDAANLFLPDSIDLTDKNGVEVSLKSLSTHSSGLPRLPGNMGTASNLDPYVDYTRENMFAFLSHYIPRSVDKNFMYSNLGAALLGEILSIYKNKPYKELLQEDILTPLDLQHTFLTVPNSQKSNFAKGYMGDQQVSHWNFKAIAPAGALRSSIKDLVKYGKSYLDPENPLLEAQKLTTSLQFKDEKGLEHGLGWFIEQNIIAHGGGTGGFRTFLAVDLSGKRVIAIMTNSGSSPAEDIAKYIIDPKRSPLDVAKEEVAITPEELQDYEGKYINDGLGLSYNFTIKEDDMHAQLSGQPEFPIYYEGDYTFFYKVVKAKIVFERDENNTVVGLMLHQNGQEIPFIKTNL
ncbi:serine hydrolase [Galbibacter sp. EGI 63066]|uniref:serine hydrolase n=1 Tax=Galbibacter sp. EGI 63066 TaxID=2993559 RepID=UPI0022498590|nr:serine hydrolase [Galbibacter sp. EGI 63066]MCX2680489.1 serine hydrolase [Galbibacter sp. EGI 63066]